MIRAPVLQHRGPFPFVKFVRSRAARCENAPLLIASKRSGTSLIVRSRGMVGSKGDWDRMKSACKAAEGH